MNYKIIWQTKLIWIILYHQSTCNHGHKNDISCKCTKILRSIQPNVDKCSEKLQMLVHMTRVFFKKVCINLSSQL